MYVNKSFIGAEPLSIISILSKAAFTLPWQNRVIVTETICPVKLRIFTVWAFTHKFAYPCFRGSLSSIAKRDERVPLSGANFAPRRLMGEGTFWSLCEFRFWFPLTLGKVLSGPQVVSSGMADDDSAEDSSGTLHTSPELPAWAALSSSALWFADSSSLASLNLQLFCAGRPASPTSLQWPGTLQAANKSRIPVILSSVWKLLFHICCPDF